MPAVRMALLDATPRDYPGVLHVGGKVRVFNEQITLAAEVAGTAIPVAILPQGCVPLFGLVTTSVTLGTAQFSIGVQGSVAKYRAAAVLTTVDAPQLFGVTAGIGDPLAATERVLLTTSVATLPASGTLRVQIFYVDNS